MDWVWKSIAWTQWPGQAPACERPPDEVMVREPGSGVVRALSRAEIAAWWPGARSFQASLDAVRDQLDAGETWRDREPLL